MNFDYTDEQKQFAESVRRFAQDHLAAGALRRAHETEHLSRPAHSRAAPAALFTC